MPTSIARMWLMAVLLTCAVPAAAVSADLSPGEWEIRFLKASSQVDSNGIALKGRSVAEVCPDP
jgi:hypothetical protein